MKSKVVIKFITKLFNLEKWSSSSSFSKGAKCMKKTKKSF